MTPEQVISAVLETQSSNRMTTDAHARLMVTQDPKLNSHSKLNCILACIAAEKAEAFLTGTFGAQTPVGQIDGRQIAQGKWGR